MNQFFDKIEAQLRQVLRGLPGDTEPSDTPTVDAQMRAAVLTAFAMGRMQRYARSGFRHLPSEHLEALLALLLR